MSCLNTLQTVNSYNTFISNFFEDKLEVEFILHEDCNLDCQFCSQTDYKESRYNPTLIDQYIELFDANIGLYTSSTVDVHIVGGELFQDKYSDSVLHDYERLITHVRRRLSNRKVSFEITSNLIFKNVDRVIDFILRNNVNLSTSFDFVGRFKTDSVKRLWFRNLDKINEYVPLTVNIVKHKYNIIKLLQSDDGDLAKIYNKNTVCFLEFISTKNNELFRPTNQLLADLDEFIIERYPKCEPYQHLKMRIDGVSQSTDKCGIETLDINQRGVATQCCNKGRQACIIATRLNCMLCRYKDYCEIDCPSNFLRNLNGNYCYHKHTLSLLANKVH